jgi:hypothetical protein
VVMSTAALRFAPTRFRRRSRESVESLTARIETLTAERQALRSKCASAGSLERNRVKLARAQWELSHALIERHLTGTEARSAA